MFMLEREHVKKSATARDAAAPFSLSDIEFRSLYNQWQSIHRSALGGFAFRSV